jgi:hypothetical protein
MTQQAAAGSTTIAVPEPNLRRDMSTYWSHNTPAQRDLLLLRLGRMRLALPLDRPGMLPSRQPASGARAPGPGEDA